MKYGIVKAAAVTPVIRVGEPDRNAEEIIKHIKKLRTLGVEIAVFPELCVTGYTCADLFFTETLRRKAVAAVKKIAAAAPPDMIVFVGAPIEYGHALYNCAVGMSDGHILGVVPKIELPDYNEFYEPRHFRSGASAPLAEELPALDGAIFGRSMTFACADKGVNIACEICEDMWSDVPPSVECCRDGANIVVNLSASDEVVGKAEYRRLLVASASGRMHCAYIYADAGEGESSTDVVFSAHNIIAENGSVTAESLPFEKGLAIADIDVGKLTAERLRMCRRDASSDRVCVGFSLGDGIKLTSVPSKYPFVPSGEEGKKRAELILNMQARGLKTRFEATGAKCVVLGVSGGLDSTLALMVCVRAVGREKVRAITMPCFGTGDKTLSNAKALCEALGVELTAVDIKNTVSSHLADISHEKKDVTFENAQARTRTMTLFDIANRDGGLVVGTGDMSELALGWATYNGDHMSSYGVNAGVPKTLVKYLVKYEGERVGGKLKKAADAVLGTDISPELLPPEDGKITQKTEDILGKYDLHDFIMYYYCRYGFDREKLRFLLGSAFDKTPTEELERALDTFFKRFFASQFKRSCLPDGVKIGSVSFSPRSDWRMPSDVRVNE